MKNQEDIDIYKLYLNDIRNFDILSQEEIVDLIKKARNGDIDARNKIIEHNLKLVVSIAKKRKNIQMTLLDSIQVGNETIIACIRNYNIDSGVKFCHYLVKCVELAIMHEQLKSLYIVKIPKYVVDIIENIKKYCNNYLLLNSREATQEEILNDLQVKRIYVDLYHLIRYGKLMLNIDKLAQMEDMSCECDYYSNISETISEEDENLDKVLSKIDNQVIINYILDSDLKDRYKYVLFYKYGLIDGEKHSNVEVAKKCSVTPERIRQIEALSISKLKNYINRQQVLTKVQN